jgi:hypothetical protein
MNSYYQASRGKAREVLVKHRRAPLELSRAARPKQMVKTSAHQLNLPPLDQWLTQAQQRFPLKNREELIQAYQKLALTQAHSQALTQARLEAAKGHKRPKAAKKKKVVSTKFSR